MAEASKKAKKPFLDCDGPIVGNVKRTLPTVFEDRGDKEGNERGWQVTTGKCGVEQW